jgi:hypothetical protein
LRLDGGAQFLDLFEQGLVLLFQSIQPVQHVLQRQGLLRRRRDLGGE